MPTGSREGWDRRPGLSSSAGVCVRRTSDLVVALVPGTLFAATALLPDSGGRAGRQATGKTRHLS